MEGRMISEPSPGVTYARRLGLFSGVMMVIGGIIGAGIFRSPQVVAQRVLTPGLTLGAWVLGGVGTTELAPAIAAAAPLPRRPGERRSKPVSGSKVERGALSDGSGFVLLFPVHPQ